MSEETKKCPFCGEEIKAVAVKCRFCNEMLNKNTAQNPSTYEKNGLDIKRFLLGLLIFPLGCAVLINLVYWLTSSWVASSIIATLIILLILLCSAVGFTYGYLKFARAKGFWASALIFLIMALPMFNIGGFLATWLLSFIKIGSGGVVIELIVCYILWFCASLSTWMQMNSFCCANCKKWSDETYKSVALEKIDNIETLKKQLEDNNISTLMNLKDADDDAENRSLINVCRCSQCGDAYIWISAITKRPFRGLFKEFKYVIKKPSICDATGKITDFEDIIVSGQLISHENFEILKQRLNAETNETGK